jgi:plasmid stabilization system protein ParE
MRAFVMKQVRKQYTYETYHFREAKRDIEDIVRYIALDSFRKAFNNSCELLLHTPEIGSHRGFYNPALDDLRMMRLHNFTNYLIFYRPPREEKIEIIRHGARDLPTLFE